MIIRSKEDFITTAWSKGTTTQLYLAPEDGDYNARKFDVRLSVATLPEEESLFTSLPGVKRTLLLLEGSTILTVNGCGNSLTAGMQCSFLGDDVTTSFGAGVDLNLMVCNQEKITLRYRELSEGESITTGFAYIHTGSAIVEEQAQKETVTGPCLIMGGQLTVSCMGQLAMVELISID